MAHGGHHPREQHGHHIIPLKTLLIVFGVLVFLTIFTVASSQIDLGALNVPLALLIAGTKAGFVVAVFMALKYDNRVNAVVFSFGVIFVLVFLSFTLFDTAFRGDVGNVDPQTVSDRERLEEAMRARDPGPGGPVDSGVTGETTEPSEEGAEEAAGGTPDDVGDVTGGEE